MSTYFQRVLSDFNRMTGNAVNKYSCHVFSFQDISIKANSYSLSVGLKRNNNWLQLLREEQYGDGYFYPSNYKECVKVENNDWFFETKYDICSMMQKSIGSDDYSYASTLMDLSDNGYDYQEEDEY